MTIVVAETDTAAERGGGVRTRAVSGTRSRVAGWRNCAIDCWTVVMVFALGPAVALEGSLKKSVPAASRGVAAERERRPRGNPGSTHESSQRSSPKGFSPNSASQRQATNALRFRALCLCADAHGTKSCPQRGHSTCAPLTCVAPRAWS